MHDFDNFAKKAVAQEKAKTEQVVKVKHHADAQLMAAMTQVSTQHKHKHNINTNTSVVFEGWKQVQSTRHAGLKDSDSWAH